MWELSVLSVQFFYKPKTALKIKSSFKKYIGTNKKENERSYTKVKNKRKNSLTKLN